MNKHIANYINSGHSGLYIESFEEVRVASEVMNTAKAIGFQLFKWTVTDGIINLQDASVIADTENPVAMLEQFGSLPERSILFASDFHMFLREPDPILIRKLKDVLRDGKMSNRVFLIVGCELKLQPEIEKDVVVLEFDLPSRDQLEEVALTIAKDANAKLKKIEDVIDAASGMTTIEAENAFALSIVESKTIDPSIVWREKCQAIKKNGLLTVVDQKITLDDVGGLENLKEALISERRLFTKAARDYGLPSPQHKFIVGQGGTGKSLTAKAAQSVFGVPLIRLEAGALFGSLVGQSEAHWRSVWKTIKAIGRCVLWIDEAEGLFKSMQSSGQTDGGTSARVIKAILQDLQDDSEDVLVIFTANDIDGCPDPLIDRCDVWSVDLPNKEEREAIWKIHIAKRGRDPKSFNTRQLANLSAGYSGRQIERAWIKGLTTAFNDDREPDISDINEALRNMVATSVTMKHEIESRRARLQNRAQNASKPEGKESTGTRRKIAA